MKDRLPLASTLLTLMMLITPVAAPAAQTPTQDPGEAESWLLKGAEQQRAGQYGAAIEAYQKALQLKREDYRQKEV